MIDVYNKNGVPTVYHTYSYLGSEPFVSNLQEIKTFMDNNPNEIVTLILECYTSSSLIEQAMNEVGLLPFCFEKEFGSDWFTLQEMINTNKRLVVFSDKNDATPTQKWYHFLWDYAVETKFSYSNISSFDCEYNRGEPENDLFIINHFITNAIGVGQISAAQQANSNPLFIDRIINCWQTNHKFPNFITVDFFEVGNSIDVVNFANNLETEISEKTKTFYKTIKVFPNPCNNAINIEIPENLIPPFTLSIFNSNGCKIIFMPNVKDYKFSININKIDISGTYSFVIIDSNGNQNCMKFVVN